MAKRERNVEEIEELVYDENERRSTARFFAILLSVITLFLLILNFWSQNFSLVQVSGASMDKTLYNEEYLLAYKVIHPEYELKRGDIVVVEVGDIPEWQAVNQNRPASQRTDFIIKRVIALEGDIVRCTYGEMEICYAGTWDEMMDPAEYPFVTVDEPYAYYDEKTGGRWAPCNTFQYRIGEGEIFFLGDNRNNSKDSRYMQEGCSEIKRLYKATDVVAVVPDWALKHQTVLQNVLVDYPRNIRNFVKKLFKK